MIVVRDIFQLHFGKAQEAIKHIKRGSEILADAGYPVVRILTDVTGPYYTVVMESQMESLAEFEAGMSEAPGIQEWQQIYREKLVPLVREGRREIFRVVD